MRRNRNILVDQLNQKFMAQSTKTLITSTFMNALPFSQSAIAEESAELVKFSNRVLSALQPETLFERAIEAVSDSDYKASLTEMQNEVKNIISGSADSIANETVNSSDSTPEIVAAAKMDDEATRKLVALKKNAGLSEVSKIIKDNVVDAIKRDKESYEEEQKIRNDIKEVLKKESEDTENAESETNGEEIETNGEAIESYLDYMLAPTDARHPISLLSKLQDISMEGLLYLPQSFDDFNADLAANIVIESTFKDFDTNASSLSQVLEQLAIASEGENEYLKMNDDEKREKMKSVSKTAFICSICILTMLQTLKTMHFITPNATDVKDIIERKTDYVPKVSDKFEETIPAISKEINNTNMAVSLGSYNLSEAIEQQDTLRDMKKTISRINVKDSLKDVYESTLGKLDTTLDTLEDYINEKQRYVADRETPITSSLDSKLKENNIAILEHAIDQLRQYPDVDTIRIPLNSEEEIEERGTAIIPLQGMHDFNVMRENTAKLEVIPEFGDTLAEVVMNTAKYCNCDLSKVFIYYTDGNYTVPIKQ